MIALILVNESPYGSERAFNALRLALALQKSARTSEVRLFFASDGVYCAMPNHLRGSEEHSIEALLAQTIAAGAKVKLCSVCSDSRGLFTVKLPQGVTIGSMTELADWVTDADRIVTF